MSPRGSGHCNRSGPPAGMRAQAVLSSLVLLTARAMLAPGLRKVVDRVHGDLPGELPSGMLIQVRSSAEISPLTRVISATAPQPGHRQAGRSSPAGAGGTEPDGASTGASAGTVSG